MIMGLNSKEQAAIYLTLDLFKFSLKNFPLKLFQPDQFDEEINNQKEPVLITKIIKSLLTAFHHPSKKSCDHYWVFLLKRLIDNNLGEFGFDINPIEARSFQRFPDTVNPFYDLKFIVWIRIFESLVFFAISEGPEIKKEIDKQIKLGRSSFVQLKPVGKDSKKNLKFWHAGSTRVYSQDKDDKWLVACSNLEEMETLAQNSTPHLQIYFTRQIGEIKAYQSLCEKIEREKEHQLFLIEQDRLERERIREEERIAEEEREFERQGRIEQQRIEKEALIMKFKSRPKRGERVDYYLPDVEESDHESDLLFKDQENVATHSVSCSTIDEIVIPLSKNQEQGNTSAGKLANKDSKSVMKEGMHN